MKKIYSSIFSGLCIFQIMHGQPTITSLSPIVGPVGSTVVISGTGFNATNSLNTVYFGATKALVNNASASSLTVAVPFGANNFPLSVLNGGTGLIAYSAEPFQTNFLCPANISTTALSPKVDFTYGSSNTPLDVMIADFDGDGKSDMATAIASSGSGSMCVQRNISVSGTITNTSFAAFQFFALPDPANMAIADINGDGKLDIVTCSYSFHNFSVLKNTSTLGNISFDPPITFFLSGGTSGPNGLAVDDLDMDGKADVVIASYNSGKIAVFKNNSSIGSVTFAPNVDFTSMPQTNMPAIGDFDGDGKKDIAATNNSVITVFKNTTTLGVINLGSFAAAVNFTSSTGLTGGIAARDLDGDAKIDLVATSIFVGNIYIYRNTSTSSTITLGSFAAPLTYTIANSSVHVSIGELNGDNKPEIVVPLYGNIGVSLFQNNSIPGTINFSPKVDFVSGGAFGRSIALGDVDNDGKNDVLAVCQGGGGLVSVFRNLGGISTSVLTTSVSCNGGTNGQIQLTASSANTTAIVWSNSATTFTINNLIAGVYNYTLTSGSCVLSQSVNVQQPAPINLTTSSSNSVLCEGQTATLTVSGATTYSWSGGSATASIAVSPSVTTNYLVTGTLNGCPSTATVTQVVSVFTLNASSSPTLLCEGETATLSASGALTYTWTGISSGSGVAVNPSITTVYTLNANNSDGCLKTTTLAVDVSACTKLNEQERFNGSILVYPNPNTGQFYLELSYLFQNGILEIYTSTGQRVLSQPISELETRLDLHSWPAGIYFVHIKENTNTMAVFYEKVVRVD